MRIFYLPIEPYPERYTELLYQWTVERWQDRAEVIVVQGDASRTHGITHGAVLDCFGRTRYSLSQMANLCSMLSAQDMMRGDDVIYFDDMFTPGIEALPYIFDQMPSFRKPRIYVRNHAQSVDPDDFTFKMRRWMRDYEHLVYKVVDGVICASSVHKEMMGIAGLPIEKVHVLGLPFSAASIQRFAPDRDCAEMRPRRVIYSSRLDSEKQPHFFLDIVQRSHEFARDIEFYICTGAKHLRSNDATVTTRIDEMQKRGLRLRVKTGATKAEYYDLLASSRVQLNTARQDFISYTAIEASALGTATLAPAFRSFPEALRNRPANLYVPWSVEDAERKLRQLVDFPETDGYWLSRTQDATLDRIIKLFQDQQIGLSGTQESWWETENGLPRTAPVDQD